MYLFILEQIESYLAIWLLAFILKWLISFLPKKMLQFIQVFGNVFRFPIMKVYYWIFGVYENSINWDEGEIETRQIKDFDCLFTTLILAPFLLLTFLSGIFFDIANTIYESYTLLGYLVFFIGFATILVSIPEINDIKKLGNVRVLSIVKWFVKLAVILMLFAVFSLHDILPSPYIELIFVLFVSTPTYHFSKSHDCTFLSTFNQDSMEIDPFGD